MSEEGYSEELELPPEVHQLHSAILDLQVTQEVIDERITQFRERIKLDGVLPACGSCFVDEDELGKPTRSYDKTDLFSVKPDPSPFVRLSLDDPLVEVLQLTEEQERKRNSPDVRRYKHVYSAYEDHRRSNALHCSGLRLRPYGWLS